jgi:hypothetical protein
MTKKKRKRIRNQCWVKSLIVLNAFLRNDCLLKKVISLCMYYEWHVYVNLFFVGLNM